MKSFHYALIVLLVAVAASFGFWVRAQGEPEAPDPLRSLAAEFLGMQSTDLVPQAGPGVEFPWNHRETAVLVTYQTREGYDADESGLNSAWATVAVGPAVVMMAGWAREARGLQADMGELLADHTLQAMGAEFLRTHFPPFGEHDVLQNTKPLGSRESPVVLFDWTGPGPGDHTHKVQIGLSRVDGAPVRFSAHFRAPAPPPATPIEVSEEEARAIAEQVVRERFGDVRFEALPVATDTPLAEWGQPVYRVTVYTGPLSLWMFGVHATTGEVLDQLLPPQ